MDQTGTSIASSVLGYVAPLAAVGLGWALHELSDVFKLKREDRRAAGKALAELLEVCHAIRAVPLVMAELRKRIPIPLEAEEAVRAVFASLVAKAMEGVPERYNEAIDSLSGRLPLLAFQLRAKDQLDPFLDHARAVIPPADPDASTMFRQMEDNLRQRLLPVLDRLVLKLARLHGWRTWFLVKRMLQAPDKPSSEVSDLLDSLLKNMVNAQPQPGGPDSAT